SNRLCIRRKRFHPSSRNSVQVLLLARPKSAFHRSCQSSLAPRVNPQCALFLRLAAFAEGRSLSTETLSARPQAFLDFAISQSFPPAKPLQPNPALCFRH